LKIGQRMLVGIRFQYQKDDFFLKNPRNQINKEINMGHTSWDMGIPIKKCHDGLFFIKKVLKS
jgi:hypothetical protein